MYYISETAEVWINFILLFCSTCRLLSNSGQKNIYIHFVFKVAVFDPAWDARKKRRIIYFWGVTRKKNFCGKKNALLKHFFKDFLAQNGFHMTSKYKDFKPSSGNFLMKLCARLLLTKVVLFWEMATNTQIFNLWLANIWI